MKKILKNKFVVIAVCSLLVISLCVVIAMSVRDNEPEKEPNTQLTESTTENIETESTTESTTENTTESTTQKPETTTKKTETTTKKPNKTETTTKKPVTTTKKPETTTKKSETTTNSDDLWLKKDVWSEVGCKTEEEYEAYLATVPNYKCPYCGDHNCPSITYETNRLGDTVVGIIDESKCPAIKAEKIKCSICGKTLVDISDERWRTKPDKYCNGYCDFGFS